MRARTLAPSLLALALPFATPAPAAADDAAAASAAPAAAAVLPAGACRLSGTARMPKGTPIYRARGGDPVATFTANAADLEVGPLAPSGRVPIRTRGAVRFEGVVEASAVPLYATRLLPVVADHVWLAPGNAVKLVAATEQGAEVEARLQGALAQTVRVTTSCDTLGLAPVDRPAPVVPPRARAWVARTGELGLAAKPGGLPAFVAKVAEARGGLLLWSSETRGAWLHVVASDDLVVDAWAARADLSPLPKGEMLDGEPSAAPDAEVTRLALTGEPKVVRVARPVDVRLGPDAALAPIAQLDVGSEVVVIETVVGWSSVLPRALDVVPPEGRGFWVRASEVGIVSPAVASPAPASSR